MCSSSDRWHLITDRWHLITGAHPHISSIMDDVDMFGDAAGEVVLPVVRDDFEALFAVAAGGDGECGSSAAAIGDVDADDDR